MPAALLAWFDRSGRDLPWRRQKDPYRILLSEIMLQQTQVATVIPYYERFLKIWPTVADLAAAPEELVLKQWEGLGYYSRARNLQAAARLICSRHQGQVPAEWPALRALPGVGDYTAGAVLSIAFSQPVAAVDGNVVRVFARLAAVPWDPSDPAQRREVAALVRSLLPAKRPGDWNEALMDLGATICLPRQPDCARCPLAGICRAYAGGSAGRFPMRPVRRESPTERKTVLVLLIAGRVQVHRRPSRGLLAGLWEFGWLAADDPAADGDCSDVRQTIARQFPGAAVRPIGQHTHAFTHLRWQMTAFLVEPAGQQLSAGPASADDMKWVDAAGLAALPFPRALAGFREQVLRFLAD